MIIYALEPFYIIVLAVIVICALDILYIALIKPTIYKNKAIRLIKKAALNNKKIVHIIKNKNEGCSFSIKVDEKTYNAKVLMSPKNCDLQINNIDTFIAYIKAGSDNMKAKSITGISTFMKNKLENKIIIIPFKAKTIKKVINECEMVMVNPSVDVYNSKIYNANQIDELFK